METKFVLIDNIDLTFDDVIEENDSIQEENCDNLYPNRQMIDKFLQNCADLDVIRFI
jgi:hypothetical protein